MTLEERAWWLVVGVICALLAYNGAKLLVMFVTGW